MSCIFFVSLIIFSSLDTKFHTSYCHPFVSLSILLSSLCESVNVIVIPLWVCQCYCHPFVSCESVNVIVITLCVCQCYCHHFVSLSMLLSSLCESVNVIVITLWVCQCYCHHLDLSDSYIETSFSEITILSRLIWASGLDKIFFSRSTAIYNFLFSALVLRFSYLCIVLFNLHWISCHDYLTKYILQIMLRFSPSLNCRWPNDNDLYLIYNCPL